MFEIPCRNFILFNTNYGNGISNIGPYQYIGYIVYILLGTCLSFEHVQLNHSDSRVPSQVWINIAWRCQSRSDTLCCFWTRKCGGAHWVYRFIQYTQVCMRYCLTLRGHSPCYISVWLNPSNPNLVLFTPSCWLIVQKHYLKKNSPFLAVMWKSIISLVKFCRCVLIPLIEQLFVPSNSCSLCALWISDSILITEPTSQTPFPYFHHWTIWAPSSSVFLFIFF